MASVCLLQVFAQKEQDPDTLVWNNRQYAITVPRDVPSILMVYFQRTATQSPFNFWSSTNSRGHVASYELLNNDICLSAVEAKRFRTRIGNLWAESGIDTTVSPDYFGIHSLDTISHSDGTVVCDWFSGVVELSLIPSDKRDLKSAEYKGKRYLHIVNGNVKDNIFVSDEDNAILLKNFDDEKVRGARDILFLIGKFNNFYYRFAVDREPVVFEGHEGLFERRADRLSLVMDFFDSDPLRCPSNWEATSGFGTPMGTWSLRGDSVFLTDLSTHSGEDMYNYVSKTRSAYDYLADSTVGGVTYNHLSFSNSGDCFAQWLNGEFVIQYGSWEKTLMDVPTYRVYKTHKIKVRNGVVYSSSFTPTSFDEDKALLSTESFSICDEKTVYAVDDKQLAEAVGNFKAPKKAPSFTGDKTALRNWFLNRPLTDERAKDRLFRVRLAFMVNCKGEAGQWQLINKSKGELNEFANMVLEIVKTMPQNWIPAVDKKGKPVDCWQILEFTVSNGILTNANYK